MRTRAHEIIPGSSTGATWMRKFAQYFPLSASRIGKCSIYGIKQAKKKKARDPSGTYPFLVKYRCYITTNSMVFSVSQVVWGVMQEKRAGKR